LLTTLVGLTTVAARSGDRGSGARSAANAGAEAGNAEAQLETAVPAAPVTESPAAGAAVASPPITTAPSPPGAVAPPSPDSAPSSPGPGGSGVFAGLGTWVDAFDFSPAHTGGNPSVVPADVDRMAAAGVRTLYIQAARSEDPKATGDLLEPERLAAFTRRAHARGMQVVAWFLPRFANLDEERRHLDAIVRFTVGGRGFDAVGLDIEWRAGVADHATRSARLVDLSRHLRVVAAGLPVGAIVLPPVVTDLINTAYWPEFPWKGLAPLFDAWLPMSYWTNRSADSPYRDAYRYTAENVRMIRDHLDQPGAVVHAIGGIGDEATTVDYRRFAAACDDTGTVGRSIYDWATTAAGVWPAIAG